MKKTLLLLTAITTLSANLFANDLGDAMDTMFGAAIEVYCEDSEKTEFDNNTVAKAKIIVDEELDSEVETPVIWNDFANEYIADIELGMGGKEVVLEALLAELANVDSCLSNK